MWGKAKYIGTSDSQFTQDGEYWIVGPYTSSGYMMLANDNIPRAVGATTFLSDWQLLYLNLPGIQQIYP